MNVDPFIEAEKAQQRNVTRVCELLEVSRAASYARRAGSASARQVVDEELTEHIRAVHEVSKAATALQGFTRSCAARATGTAASGWPA